MLQSGVHVDSVAGESVVNDAINVISKERSERKVCDQTVSKNNAERTAGVIRVENIIECLGSAMCELLHSVW